MTGLYAVCAYLVESAGVGNALLGGDSSEGQAEVAGWVTSPPGDGDGEAVTFAVNAHMTLRSYMVGYSLTLADVGVYVRMPFQPDAKAYPFAARFLKTCDGNTVFGAGLKAKKAAIKAAKKAAKEAKKGGGKKGGKGGGKGGPKASLAERVEEMRKQLAALEADANADPKELKKVQSILGSLEKGLAKEQAREGGAGPSTNKRDLDLPGAVDGQVMTRFPPEPSGYLHVGHSKAALLNAHYAKKYNGRLLLRFDDTNPSKETDEFVEAITADLATLEIFPDVVSHTSDHFDTILEYAVTMIQKGLAYVDDTPVDVMRDERMNRVESAARNNSVETNMELWGHMVAGDEIGVACCLRGKIDMNADNACMRDPVFFRCNLTPHLRTKDKYKAYPTYDFACPIVDSIEGVTHALRTNEYHDRNEQFYWVCDALEIRKPVVDEYSRLNFTYTVMSKRKLQWFVDQGLVEGWFDPRFPTVQGMMRRGLTVEALWKFIEKQGSSLRANTHEWDQLWALNKKVIDPVIPRHTAIPVSSAARLTLTDVEGISIKTQPAHPKNPEVGTKDVVYSPNLWVEAEDAARCSPGEEVTLLQWGNAIIDEVNTDADGNVSLVGHLHLEGDVKSTAIKMTWLTAEPGYSTKARLVEYDHIITKRSLEKADNVADFIRSPSKFETMAYADSFINLYAKGQRFQFFRRGYFIVDQVDVSGDGITLIAIPDGKEVKGSVLSSKVTLTN